MYPTVVSGRPWWSSLPNTGRFNEDLQEPDWLRASAVNVDDCRDVFVGMAVIHFAQDDIGLAEQRLNEAKSDALARGVAMLALRDEALAPYLDEAKPDGDGSTGRNSGNRTDNKRVDGALSSRRYELDGHVAVATVHPASGFVSLNGASGYELGRLFTELGGASRSEMDALVQGVIDYRNQRSANSASLQDFMGLDLVKSSCL